MSTRILYLSPLGAFGGAERSLYYMMQSIQRSDPSIEIHLVAATEGEFTETARRMGVNVRVLAMPRKLFQIGDSALRNQGRFLASMGLAQRALAAAPNARTYALSLLKILREIKPSIIHSNGVKTHVLSRLTNYNDAPVIWHIHDFMSHRPIVPSMLRWASSHAKLAVAISHAIARDIHAVLPNLNTTVLYNGIDVEQFCPASPAAPADPAMLDNLAGLSPAPPGTLRVGLVATYARWKGHEIFLSAVARIRQLAPNLSLRFYIIGGPIYQTTGSQFTEAELRHLMASQGVSDCVGLVPFQSKPANIYRSLDIVTHTSIFPEPFGLTIVEAMACARPTIVAQSGGAAELFTHNVDALGVPPRHVSLLADSIMRLAGDGDLRLRLGANARLTALKYFNRDRLGPRLLEIYRQCMEQTGSGKSQTVPTFSLPSVGPDKLRFPSARANDNIRIIFLNPIGELGGGERNLLDVIVALRESLPASAFMHLLALADGPFVQAVRQAGITASVLPMPEEIAIIGDSALRRSNRRLAAATGFARFALPAIPATFQFSQLLKRVLGDFQPTLIHSNGIKSHILSRLAKLPNVPVIWQVQDFVAARPVVARTFAWASTGVEGAIAISQSIARDIQSIAPHLPITTIYSAIDTDYFAPGPRTLPLDELAGFAPLPANFLRIGIIAAYARWKGQDVFLRAAAQLLRDHPGAPVRFYVIGGPIYLTKGSQFSQAELREMAAEQKISDRVAFVDFQKDVAAAYRSLDIVVHASTQPEPFGRTIVEAMACEKPVIVSRAGGAAELFTEDVDAKGVSPGDAVRLAACMYELLCDGEKRRNLATHARQNALRRFARGRLGPETMALYKTLIAFGGSARE